MKRIIIVAVALLLGLCAVAQSGKQGGKQLDSLRYILPDFSEGTVVYADKQISRGKVNISPLDQAVYCITAPGDTVTASNYQNITGVSVDGRSFSRWKEYLVENIIIDGKVGIGIVRTTVKVNNVKTGAYGMADNISSIRSYSVDNQTGSFKMLIIDDPKNYAYRVMTCLYKDGNYFNATKKMFQKLFPEQKEFIESVWNERKLGTTGYQELIDFFKELNAMS